MLLVSEDVFDNGSCDLGRDHAVYSKAADLREGPISQGKMTCREEVMNYTGEEVVTRGYHHDNQL